MYSPYSPPNTSSCTNHLVKEINAKIETRKQSRGRLCPKKCKFCFDRESNTGPQDLQSCALPTELSKHSLMWNGQPNKLIVKTFCCSANKPKKNIKNKLQHEQGTS
jgi:hypothetical protein